VLSFLVIIILLSIMTSGDILSCSLSPSDILSYLVSTSWLHFSLLSLVLQVSLPGYCMLHSLSTTVKCQRAARCMRTSYVQVLVGRVRIIAGAYARYLGTVALAYVSSARS
jgi:hypothetical protein